MEKAIPLPLRVMRQKVSGGNINTTVAKAQLVQEEDKEKPWDWTSALPQTEHILFFRSFSWEESELGPLESWTACLRQAVYQLFSDSRPATLYWGPQYIPIYNENFVPLAGKTHPALMGSTFKKGFPELWDSIRPLFERATKTGVAADVKQAPMTVERNGYPEEAWFTGNFTPIRDSDGKIQGFYNALFEITQNVVWDRKTAMLNLISTPDSLDHATHNVCQHIIHCLETNDIDITMAIMYQVENELENGQYTFHLGGFTGIPPGHSLLVDGCSWDCKEGLIPLCRETQLLQKGPITYPVDDRFEGIQWRGAHGGPATFAVLPLSIGGRLFGFLIVGTNPRLLDASNMQLLNDLARMASATMASAVSSEENRLRQRRLESDLVESDLRMHYLIQHAALGIVHLQANGGFVWANNHYWEITGLRDEATMHEEFAFFSCILEEDLPLAEREWKNVVSGGVISNVEIRLNRLYTPEVGPQIPSSIMICAFPYYEDGGVKSVMAIMTDISRLKWAESWQARLAEDARDAKRQQEAFIDCVSHEMRNPLSAILHCADDIIAAFEECHAKGEIPPHCVDALSENAAAARIIETCATHQKYIIDSVLTIGRLESDMLSFTPGPVQPGAFAKSTMTMFDAEFRANNISASIVAAQSLADLKVIGVITDASRVTQIFINLISNAIKFVKSEPKREIQVKYGACISSPRSCFPDGVHWARRASQVEDVSASPDWGDGEQIYLTFSINDSGIGIKDEEKSKIFDRFEQANVKTHVRYGGSGLGLYISRQLVEKQGGEIGVRSTPGKGSMFVFYIHVRRVQAGTNNTVQAVQERRPSLLRTYSFPVVSPEGPNMPTATPNERIHVLLVEDNVINQQVLRKQLSRAGCVVYVANHGADCLDQLRNMTCWKGQEKSGIPVDMILMDTQMPIMDGLTCTKEIRKLEAEGLITCHLPLIAVTANARDEQVDDVITAGSDAVMTKPFKSADLVELMKEQIALFRSCSIATNYEYISPDAHGGLSNVHAP